MSFVKSKLRNKIGVSLLDDCLQSNTNGLNYICLFVSNFLLKMDHPDLKS
jgi:hypothetical protein